jgi:hypothetical protein
LRFGVCRLLSVFVVAAHALLRMIQRIRSTPAVYSGDLNPGDDSHSFM